MSLCFVLLMSSGNQTALDRYAEIVQRAQALQVTFESRGLQASLTYEPEKRLRMVAKGKGVDYLLVEKADRVLEINYLSREYDEGPLVQLGSAPARVSSVSSIMPGWLLQGDLRSLLPDGSYVNRGSKKVSTGEGTLFFNRAVSPDKTAWQETSVVLTVNGTPLDVHIKGRTKKGPYEYQWAVSGFRAIARPAASTYAPKIPDGYTPFAVPTVFGMPETGAKMPLQGWKANSGDMLDIRKALPEGGLVAILGAASDPSDRAKASVQHLQDRKLPVLVLSDQKTSFASGYDAGGLKKLGAPATPLFLKLDAEGAIVGIWLGFDAANAKQFEQDVMDAK